MARDESEAFPTPSSQPFAAVLADHAGPCCCLFVVHSIWRSFKIRAHMATLFFFSGVYFSGVQVSWWVDGRLVDGHLVSSSCFLFQTGHYIFI